MEPEEFAELAVRRFFPDKGVSINRKYSLSSILALLEDYRKTEPAERRCGRELDKESLHKVLVTVGFSSCGIPENAGETYYNIPTKHIVRFAEKIHENDEKIE